MRYPAISGFLAFDKPAGLVSRYICDRLQRIYLRNTKFGHCGTLDPLASGVIVVAVGSATRLLRWLPDSKTYEAVIALGVGTDTDDVLGRVTTLRPLAARPSDADLEVALRSFTGTTDQVPPAFSAVRYAGKRAFHAALALGADNVQLTARPVTAHSISFEGWVESGEVADGLAPEGAASEPGPQQSVARASEAPFQEHADPTSGGTTPLPSPESALAQAAGPAFPRLRLRVQTLSGFFVRSLARDHGRALPGPGSSSGGDPSAPR